MATFTVTTSNWDSASFWSAINESAQGHTLDFSALPSFYTVNLNEADGTITLSDGSSTFVVGDAGSSASVDATMGGSTSLTFFDDIQGNGGADVIDSGSGDDTVDGSGGNDDISSGDGADFVTGGTGADTIDGGDGDDTLIGGSESDQIESGGGADEVAGGTGDDTITNTSGEDTIDAGSGDDSVTGSDDAETISGGSGDDTIQAGGGDDLIMGDSGADLGTYAGSLDSFNFNATDTSTGDTGNGTIGSYAYYNNIGTTSDGTPISARLTIIDAGDPNIAVEFNNNSVFLNRDGQADAGTPVQLQFEFFDAVTGEPVQIDGTFTFQDVDTTSESVTANSTDVTSVSTSANPSTNLDVINDGDQLGASSDNTSSGNADENHWAQFAVDGQQTIVFTVTSRGGGTNYGFSSTDFTNTPNTVTPVAGTYDDLIDAGAGNDTVYGGQGNDTIDGGTGNDSLHGDAGDDSLIGGTSDADGANYLIGGEGADTLDGSAGGWDVAGYYDATSGVAVSAVTGGSAGEAAGDVLIDIEQIDGSDFNDTISGGNGVLEINGGGGDDEITGGSNAETIHGGDGADTVFGNGGDDTILGEAGDDSLDGDAGSDFIDGGTGNDTLIGDAGDDTLIGGDGNDEVYDSNAVDGGNDSIDLGAGNDTAFSGAGDDTIDGGAGDDSIFGGDGNDQIDGGAGGDTLNGGIGDDTIDAVETTTSGIELIQNGSFEDGTHAANGVDGLDGWSNAGGSPDSADDGTSAESWNPGNSASDGTGYVTMWASNTGPNEGMTQTLTTPLTAGSTYEFSLDAISAEYTGGQWFTPSDIPVTFEIVDASTGEVIGSTTIQGTEYERYTFEITPTTDVSQIILRPNTQGEGNNPSVIIDQVSLQEVVPTAPEGDVVSGGDDADMIEAGGNDTVDGGAGGNDDDTLIVDDVASVNITGLDSNGNGYNGTITFNDGTTLTFTEIENLVVDGTPVSPDNIVSGTAAGDVIGSGFTDTDGTSVDGGDALGTHGEVAGSDADSIQAGAGDDTIDAGAGDDTIDAGDGEDHILDSAGDDSVFGGEGRDRFDYTTITGNDTVVGGELNDTAAVNSGDRLDAHDNADDLTVIFTGDEAGTMTDGNDTVTFTEIEHIMLGTGDDVIDASSATTQQILDGGGGSDTIQGGSGDDIIALGLTQDFSATDGANDTLVLMDGFGNDSIEGFETPTDLGGGNYSGNDQLNVAGLTDADGDPVNVDDVTVSDTNGDGTGDAILSFPNGESITLWGVTVGDVSSDAQLIAMGIPPAPGPVDGTSGDDLMQPDFTDVHGDQIDGTDGDNDTIFGYEGDDTIDGGDGDDTIDGGTDNDSIRGQGGDDSIDGNMGDDTIRVTDGNDTVDGGDDADLIVVTEEAGDVVVDGGAGGTDNDTLDVSTVLEVSGWTITADGDESGTATHGSGTTIDYTEIEVIQGSSNDDTFDLTLDTDGATAFGGQGDDTMIGGTGDDSLRGDAGDDSLVGGTGADTLEGGAGSDTINGGTGADSIAGGDDADTIALENDFGDDTITGGEGVTTGADDDTLDLSAVTDNLTIDLTGADPEAGTVSDGTSTATFTEIENIVLGAGRDRVVLADGSGADVVQAFDMTDSGDGTTMDQLDVSGMTDANGAIVNTDDVVVSDDGAGNAVLTFPGGESIVLVGVSPAQLSTPAELGSIGIPVPDYIVEGTGTGELIDSTFVGDPEGDVIDGGDHSDGSDNDSVQAGGGDDTVFSGAGDDTVDGGTGNDEIHGGDGADSLLGGADNDTLYGGEGADTVEGGTGNDSIEGWLGDDSLLGGDGDDYIDGAQGDDTLEGGEGNDTLLAGSDDGDDLLDGGAGNDSLSAGDGEDTLLGGTGDDSMFGGGGDDVFVLEDDFGNDTIDGWSTGETNGDTLDLSNLTTNTTIDLTSADPEDGTVSDGTSTARFDDIENIILGGGRDTLVLGDGGGDDIVNAFDMTDSGDGTTLDQLDVSGMTDADGNPVDVFDVVVTDTNGDGSGDAILTFPNGESITLVGVTPDQVDSVPELNSIGIPCFTPGTMILTARGDVPVETIRPGDLVHTMDHGLQPVRWAGARKLNADDLEAHPDLKPVLIRKGSFGNSRKMLVSPQHAFLVDDADGERLIRAKHAAETLGGQVARKVKECDKVTYVHIMFDRHEVIFADGARSESFYPGPAALRSLDHEALTEMLLLFPDLATVALGDDQPDLRFGEPVRPYLLRSELRKLPRGEEGLERLKA